MQAVNWQLFSPFSQHNSFYQIVRSLLEQVKMVSFSYDKPVDFPDINICGANDLLERAALRESAYCVSGFGAENHTVEHVIEYAARDLIDNDKEYQVFQIAKSVDESSVNLGCRLQLLHEMNSWKKPLRHCPFEDLPTLGFDLKWLDPLEEISPKIGVACRLIYLKALFQEINTKY